MFTREKSSVAVVFAWLVLATLSSFAQIGSGNVARSQIRNSAGLATSSPAPSVSLGLPAPVQSSISAMLGRDIFSYHVQRSNLGFHTQTSREMATDFRTHGIEVTRGSMHWGMALRGYGRDVELQSTDKVAPVANLNRVEYRRGPLTEWYVNGPAGVEQGFTFKDAPVRREGKPLTIALALSGDFSASVTSDRKGLSVKDRDRKSVLSYAGLTAYDSSGKELPVWVELRGNELLLRVEDTAATYPVTVDPIIQLAPPN